MLDLVIRPVDRADLPRLLDLYAHLHLDDARYAPDDAIAVLDHLLAYEAASSSWEPSTARWSRPARSS